MRHITSVQYGISCGKFLYGLLFCGGTIIHVFVAETWHVSVTRAICLDSVTAFVGWKLGPLLCLRVGAPIHLVTLTLILTLEAWHAPMVRGPHAIPFLR